MEQQAADIEFVLLDLRASLRFLQHTLAFSLQTVCGLRHQVRTLVFQRIVNSLLCYTYLVGRYSTMDARIAGASRSSSGSTAVNEHAADDVFLGHLQSCFWRSARSGFTMPWEVSQVLTRRPQFPSLPQPRGPLPVPPSAYDLTDVCCDADELPARRLALEEIGARLIKKQKYTDWDAQLTEERELAIKKWLAVIHACPVDFEIARSYFSFNMRDLAAGTSKDVLINTLSR